MSLTAFATITGALEMLMRVEPPVSANIFRARDREMAEQYEDAVSVQFDGATPMRGAIKGAPVDWVSSFTIDLWRRTTTTSADLAVDPLLLAIYARIAADTTLGGLVDDIDVPTIQAEYTAEQQKTGWIRMTYPVTHRTSNLTLEMP